MADKVRGVRLLGSIFHHSSPQTLPGREDDKEGCRKNLRITPLGTTPGEDQRTISTCKEGWRETEGELVMLQSCGCLSGPAGGCPRKRTHGGMPG
ncbi:hypothetical protein O3P69_012276 [Scylla paramamosain]|uniref:Uncharacterized protein n=1 Tax=Scylla paramamosain TaxID=85552 RepID=A0AAW0TEU2_SCYPA